MRVLYRMTIIDLDRTSEHMPLLQGLAGRLGLGGVLEVDKSEAPTPGRMVGRAIEGGGRQTRRRAPSGRRRLCRRRCFPPTGPSLARTRRCLQRRPGCCCRRRRRCRKRRAWDSCCRPLQLQTNMRNCEGLDRSEEEKRKLSVWGGVAENMRNDQIGRRNRNMRIQLAVINVF